MAKRVLQNTSEQRAVEGAPPGEPALSRRTALAGAAALGTTLVASGACVAADSKGHRHTDHAPQHPGALSAANDCADKAQTCLSHCLVSFQEGDTTLADCAKKVSDMLPICEAFAQQVASNSPYTVSLGKVCRQACQDCEKECRKHEKMHLECRECADACVAIVAAIDRM